MRATHGHDGNCRCCGGRARPRTRPRDGGHAPTQRATLTTHTHTRARAHTHTHTHLCTHTASQACGPLVGTTATAAAVVADHAHDHGTEDTPNTKGNAYFSHIHTRARAHTHTHTPMHTHGFTGMRATHGRDGNCRCCGGRARPRTRPRDGGHPQHKGQRLPLRAARGIYRQSVLRRRCVCGRFRSLFTTRACAHACMCACVM